jgi:hypothetical protein
VISLPELASVTVKITVVQLVAVPETMISVGGSRLSDPRTGDTVTLQDKEEELLDEEELLEEAAQSLEKASGV